MSTIFVISKVTESKHVADFLCWEIRSWGLTGIEREIDFFLKKQEHYKRKGHIPDQGVQEKLIASMFPLAASDFSKDIHHHFEDPRGFCGLQSHLDRWHPCILGAYNPYKVRLV